MAYASMILLAVTVAVSFLALPAKAQVFWNNTTNTSSWFHQGFNWTPNGTPGPGSDARFTPNATYQVWWDAATQANSPSVGFLEVAGGNVTFLNLDASPQHLLHLLGFSMTDPTLSVSNATLNLSGIHLWSSLGGARIFDNGQLSIDGSHPSGSRLTVSGGFDFFDVDGTLNVTGPNAVVDINSYSAIIGRGDGSLGTVTVSGGSHWDANITSVGGDGTGTLNVQDQGLATSSALYINNGALNVADRGVVTSAIGSIGHLDGTIGTATVTGIGSQWTDGGSHSLFIGDRGSGTLNVEAGGTVTYSYCNIGYTAGSSGTATVTGSGSRWDVNEMIVGYQGNGTLNVASGGVVATTGWSHVGHEPGSFGFVTVTGSGSQWNISDSLQIGRFGNGVLNIANGGSVAVVNLSVVDFGSQINNINSNFVSNTVINQPGGEITGRGLFSALGGWSNFGTLFFGNGLTNVYGPVGNMSGGMISTASSSTTVFHGNVVHDGFEIRTGNNAHTHFQDDVSGGGNYPGAGTVTMNKTFRPGNSPDVVNFGGSLTFGSGNTTHIELGGLNSGQFDQLLVAGALHLNNSSLNVSLWNGFTLAPNMQFLIADVGGSLVGQFAGLGEGSLVGNFGGTNLFITYNGFAGNAGVGLYTLAQPEATIDTAYVVHNGYTGAGSSRDAGKVLHLESATPTALTYANLINSSRGINGVGFDISGARGTISLQDFVFQMSPQGAFNAGANPPSGWANAPNPTLVFTPGTPGQIAISWNNNAIANRWLRVTILANPNTTGLASNQVFYIGHLLGESGPASAIYTVAFADIAPIRNGIGTVVNSDNTLDIDKNGIVAFADISAMQSNVGAQLTNLTVGQP